jgi:hypothetical protein
MLFLPPVIDALENHPPPDGAFVDRLELGRDFGSDIVDEVADGSFWWFVDSEGGGFFRRSFRGIFLETSPAGEPGISVSEARSGASAAMMKRSIDKVLLV